MSYEFSTHGITVEFDDNSPEILKALENAVERGLEAIGTTAVRYAQQSLTQQKAVDTGNLRENIEYQVEGEDCYIGTNVKYAAYVEFGTGIYYPGGRTDPWVYQDAKGQWHMTHGQPARPFLRPAASEHTPEYRELLIKSLENA